MQMKSMRVGAKGAQGYILMVVFAGVVPIAILASAMCLLMTSRAQLATARMSEEKLLASAEGITSEGLAWLNHSGGIATFPLAETELQHASDGKDNDGDHLIDEADEIGEVRIVSDWTSDGLDNDGDGVVDEDDEQARCLLVNRRRDADGLDNDGDGTIDEPDENYLLALIGEAQPHALYAGARKRRVTAYLQYSQALLPTVEAALFLGDPNSEIKFNGNSFLVSGNDVDMSGNATGVSLPGIGVDGSIQGVINSLNNNQNTNVIGSGPSPSVATVSVPNPFNMSSSFIDDMIAVYSPVAHYFISGGGTITSNPQGSDGLDNDGDSSVDEADESLFGSITSGSMEVTYVQGNAHFSGNNGGAGLLLVDGNLTISGQFQWEGIVVVKGDMVVTGGGSTEKLIVGAAYIGSDIMENDPNSVTIGGNAVLQYSQARIDRLASTLGHYRIWAFKEQ